MVDRLLTKLVAAPMPRRTPQHTTGMVLATTPPETRPAATMATARRARSAYRRLRGW